MTDQTRADFEAHFQLTTRQAWTHPDGSYQFPEIQAKWEGYQAGVAKAAPAAMLDQLCSRIKEMQEAAYTFGDYSKEAVSVALDGVLEAIDELPVAAAAPGAEPTYLSAMPLEHAKQHAQRLADQIDPFTRKDAPDNLTVMCAAQALRILAAPVAAAAPAAEPDEVEPIEIPADMTEAEYWRRRAFASAALRRGLKRKCDELEAQLAAAAPGAVPQTDLQREIARDAEAFEATLTERPARESSLAYPWGWRYVSNEVQGQFRDWCCRHPK